MSKGGGHLAASPRPSTDGRWQPPASRPLGAVVAGGGHLFWRSPPVGVAARGVAGPLPAGGARQMERYKQRQLVSEPAARLISARRSRPTGHFRPVGPIGGGECKSFGLKTMPAAGPVLIM